MQVLSDLNGSPRFSNYASFIWTHLGLDWIDKRVWPFIKFLPRVPGGIAELLAEPGGVFAYQPFTVDSAPILHILVEKQIRQRSNDQHFGGERCKHFRDTPDEFGQLKTGKGAVRFE